MEKDIFNYKQIRLECFLKKYELDSDLLKICNYSVALAIMHKYTRMVNILYIYVIILKYFG
jgi:hypothetical protein